MSAAAGAPTPHLMSILAFGVLMLAAVYRRMRRNFGRQPLRPKRMRTRMIILGGVGVLLAVAELRLPLSEISLIAGLAGGAALAQVGLRMTRFEAASEGLFYTPHAYIGVTLTALMLARLAYRVMVLAPLWRQAPGANAAPLSALHRSPWTLAIIGLVIGYYVLYYAGVLRWRREHAVTGSGSAG